MYGNFAGRDASRGMAKQSFDLGMNHPSIWGAGANVLFSDMLTPIDEPLDDLADLKKDEMYARYLPTVIPRINLYLFFSDNMKGS